jgi:FtsP/CotA-like multicopper oxidase with cupredoxin domain
MGRDMSRMGGPGGAGGMRHVPSAKVPTTQLAAASLISLIFLAVGLAIAALFGDLAMRAGMAMGGMEHGGMAGMSGMGGMSGMDGIGGGQHDMGPVDASRAPKAPVVARGDQPLEPRSVDGVKEFSLTVGMLRWNILPAVEVAAMAYNGQVPGPRIRLTAGERARFVITNELDEETTVHWHGQQVPNEQDGAGAITQRPIQPGETYTYEWSPPVAGTFFYHTHSRADVQQALGLYGALIVDPPQAPQPYDREYVIQIGEWRVIDGNTFPAMDLDGMKPNFFTLNGKAYPATERLSAVVGERVRIRFIGSGQFIHPMHLHGQPFEIVETDGNLVPPGARLVKDTVLVGPGERYDVEFVARAPGQWLLHCHINHHLTNDGAEEQGAGGLTMILDVSPASPR